MLRPKVYGSMDSRKPILGSKNWDVGWYWTKDFRYPVKPLSILCWFCKSCLMHFISGYTNSGDLIQFQFWISVLFVYTYPISTLLKFKTHTEGLGIGPVRWLSRYRHSWSSLTRVFSPRAWSKETLPKSYPQTSTGVHTNHLSINTIRLFGC